ncbi:MAG: Gfo/Idh/MocA family oxidoreductase [Candidatus Sumerlaeota bacterium]|nr:Gfo/Idh/MocA family oxidoreductase [Candidatus Sumerlaeota bacterium]
MNPLKIGVIGFRNIGQVHAKEIAANPETQLVAAADLREELRQEARERFGLTQVYGNYMDLIRKSDAEAVVVALPVPLHCKATMAALRAGKHVMCEKPPAASAAEARRMIDLSAQTGLVLTWGLQRRFYPEMFVARREIQAGRLGAIYRINVEYTVQRATLVASDPFRMRKSTGGGVFYDLGVHALDLAWSLLGCPKPLRVVTANHTVFPDWVNEAARGDMAEDNSMALVFFDGGAAVSVETSYCANHAAPTHHHPRLQILGDKGGLQTPSLAFVSGGLEPKSVEKRTLAAEPTDGKSERRLMHDNFVDAVRGRGPLLILAEHGYDLMRMLEAVAKSAEKGKEARLK